MKTKNSQSGHSFLGPSSAERWFACAGSINLIADLPPEAFRKNKFGAEGTVAHKIAEELITKKATIVDLIQRVGEIEKCDGFDVEISEDMINGAIEYVDAIAEARAELTRPIKVEAFAEQKVQASSIDERLWGTADYVLFQRGFRLYVVDYKFGKGVVEADRNKQMLTYAVAVEDSLAGTVFNEVVLVIVQPRARHSEGIVRSFKVSQAALKSFRGELHVAVEATKDENAPRVAGTWCKFCPAFAYCDEARKGVESAAQTAFTKLPVTTIKALPDPSLFSSQELARALEWEDAIDSWFEAVRARALAELQRDPASVPGFKVVEKKTNRQWQDPALAESAFPLLGDKIYAPRKILSPAQMEKIAGKEEVAKLTVKPMGEPTLARETDKRPALTPQIRAEEVFGQIEGPKDDIFGDMLGPQEKKMWP